jgi:hypothetical protein
MAKPIKVYENLTSAEQIIIECEELKDLLLTKNAAYGDAVHQKGPLFDIDPVTGIQARINDKLRRLQNKGLTDNTEDSLTDLIGYLIHLKIALKKKTPGT